MSSIIKIYDLLMIYEDIHSLDRSEFLRGPDRIALSSHTGSISPTAKASRGRRWRAGRLRSLHCVPCLFFSDYSPKPETGGREPCCTSRDRSPSGYLLLCFIVCSFVCVRLGSTYTILSGPVLSMLASRFSRSLQFRPCSFRCLLFMAFFHLADRKLLQTCSWSRTSYR